jgi:hypothetical protein
MLPYITIYIFLIKYINVSKGLRPNFIKEEEKVFYKSATAWQKTAEVAELKKNLGEHLAKENASQVRTTLREGLGALEEPTKTQ